MFPMSLSFGGYNIRTSGVVGTLLYSLFSLICLWRTVIVTHEIGNWCNLKVYFHVALLCNGSLELVYFMSMWIHNAYTCSAYSLHLLSMLFDVIAFSTVIYLWTKTLAYKNHANTSLYIVTGFAIINMICVFYAMVELVRLGNYEDYMDNSFSYKLVVFMNGFSIFLLSSGLLVYGWLLMRKLALNISVLENTSTAASPSLSQLASDNYTQKVRSLRRIIVILGICASCFFLRVLCLVGVLIDAMRGRSITDQPPLIVWFLASSWIPTIGPGLVLLYVTRTKQERLSRRINRTLQIYSSETNTDDGTNTTENDDERDSVGGWFTAIHSAKASSKSSGGTLSAAFWLRSEYWSGDFSLGGRGDGIARESDDNPLYDKLIAKDGKRHWSGDDMSDSDQSF